MPADVVEGGGSPGDAVRALERWVCSGCLGVVAVGCDQGRTGRPDWLTALETFHGNKELALAAGWSLPRDPDCYIQFCPGCVGRSTDPSIRCRSNCLACALHRKKEPHAE